MSLVIDARAVFPGVHGPQPADGAALLRVCAKRPGERSERRWTPGGNIRGPRRVQDVLWPLLWKLYVLRAEERRSLVPCYILCVVYRRLYT